MTCAIVEARPYLVTEEWLRDFERRRKELITSLSRMEEAMTRLTSQIAIAETAAKTDALKELLASSRSVDATAKIAAADATELQQKALSLSTRIEQSGERLKGAIRAINDRVNEEMLKTEPDLQTLKGILSGVEGMAADIVGTAWPKPPADASATPTGDGATPPSASRAGGNSEADKVYEGLLAARDKVIERQSELARIGRTLLADIQAISQLGEISKVPDCLPPEMSIPLSVSPGGEAIGLKVGDVFIVKADGGVGWLTYELTGPKTGALNVSILSQRSSHIVLMIKATEKIAEGYGPTLTISDETGNARKSLSVKAE
jgi:hypothetical protein